VPLKDKTGKSIAAALIILFQNRKPIAIQSHKGTEFVNVTVQQYLKRQGIDFHTTHKADIKGAVIERFNRTLKTKMYKYFTKNNTYRYLDVINKLLTSYNYVHSTISMPPSKVSPSNIYSVWRKVNSLRAKILTDVSSLKWAILQE
jgi:transposase InsO family protein